MKSSIYQYLDYREFIEDIIISQPNGGYGERKRLAEALGCQMAFITHVMSGAKDFNHEQILKISRHFNLGENETEFLIEMLSFNRAGTNELRDFYKRRLLKKKEDFNALKNRLHESQNLSNEEQAEYYSHWLYGALHMASTIPDLRSVKALTAYFNLPENELLPILDFLSSKGLIVLENGQIGPGRKNLYLGGESPLINQHHTIWRIKALHDLKAKKSDDFHYSLCFSIAHKDWSIVREHMVKAVNESLNVIRPSKEEKLGLICIDFQGL